MSTKRSCSRCPDCNGRWKLERHTTVREMTLPERQESHRTRWSVECENGHQFIVEHVLSRDEHSEYLVIIP